MRHNDTDLAEIAVDNLPRPLTLSAEDTAKAKQLAQIMKNAVSRKQLPQILERAQVPLAASTIDRLSSQGAGPPVLYRHGRTCMYDPLAVVLWAQQRTGIDKAMG